jgi:uncharacterized protein involved in exopolysaccharide biosynthesis
MPRYLTLRLLDSFFRRWPLYLLPIVVVGGLGVLSIKGQPSVYRSTGTFYVEGETYLSTLTAVRGGGNIGYQTPAGYYSGQLQGLLQTDTFATAVADTARYGEGELVPQRLRLEAFRRSVSVGTSGMNLVLVAAEDPDPATAHRVAEALVDHFVQWQIDTDVSASSTAQGFLDLLIEAYDEDLVEARRALDAYLAANPGLAIEELRPLAQQVVIDRLQSDVEVAEQRFANARSKQEEARLATAQTESDVRQRLQLVDAPVLPPDPQPMLKRNVMIVGLFGVAGSLLAVAALAAGTVADRSIRHPAEVRGRLGLDLLAVVPEVSR